MQKMVVGKDEAEMKEERTSDGAFSDTTLPACDGEDFLYIRYWPLRERCASARNLRGALLALAGESEGILMTDAKRRAEETRESFPTWTWSGPVHQSATTTFVSQLFTRSSADFVNRNLACLLLKSQDIRAEPRMGSSHALPKLRVVMIPKKS